MSSAFIKLWLRANTYIDGLHPRQNRQVRALCERFFEKGRKFEREKNLCYPPGVIDCAQETHDAGCKDQSTV